MRRGEQNREVEEQSQRLKDELKRVSRLPAYRKHLSNGQTMNLKDGLKGHKQKPRAKHR